MPIQELVTQGFSTRAIAKALGLSQNKVVRKLKELGLKTTPKRDPFSDGKCKICKRQPKQYDSRVQRSVCGSCWTRVRRYRMKKRAVEHLGGHCVDCGWSGHLAGFDFHHLDPAVKSFTIGSVSNKSWDSIQEEIQKCVLLCRNCHSIRHSAERDSIFLSIANGSQANQVEAPV